MTAEFHKFYVVTVYTPNAKDDLSRLPLRFKHWDPAFLAYCKQLEKTKPVIFCGDLNVAIRNSTSRIRSRTAARRVHRRGARRIPEHGRCRFRGYLSAVHRRSGHYSWWSHFANSRARNIGWRIDYVLVSGSLRNAVKSAQIHPTVMGSDHCPVSITLDA